MIAISTKDFSVDGNFTFNDHTLGYRDITKRVTRTKTLDQNVYIDDSGFAVGDNDIIVYERNVTQAKLDILNEVFAINSKFTAITDLGNYTVVLKSMAIADGTATIQFYIESEL